MQFEQQRQQDDEIEIDLKALFFELLGHWKMIGISIVMVAAIAFVISKFIMTPQYQSTSALYVLNSTSSTIASLTDLQVGTNLTNDYLVIVKGRPVLDQVISDLGLEENYRSLLANVSISNPSDSRILEITVTDPDPSRAKMIADQIAVVAQNFISENMKQGEPSIIQKGYADGSPVSPSVGKNTLIGALVGLLLAAAIVVISYLLNDTIMSGEDVEKKLGLNFLGSLPEETAEDDGEKRKKKKKYRSRVTQKPANKSA